MSTSVSTPDYSLYEWVNRPAPESEENPSARQWKKNQAAWHDIEKDSTRAGAWPEDLQAAIDAGKAK